MRSGCLACTVIGAAALILERFADDAAVRGTILGTGAAWDAVRIAAPDDTGRGMATAMRVALASAGVDAIGSVNCHGTSTPLNDKIEAQIVASVIGPTTVMTSNKGTTGHMVGASGVAEVIVAAHTARTGLVPPTASTTAAISGAVVIGTPAQSEPGAVISNSFGFGGQNACIVVGSDSTQGNAK